MSEEKYLEEKKIKEMEKELRIINEMNDFDKENIITDIILLGKNGVVKRICLK